MSTFRTSLFWSRVDTAGSDHALVDDHSGLHARGVAVAATPVPHTCRYELVTDEHWATARLDVSTEGAGWLRTVRLELAAGRWRVTTAEQGNLAAALAAAGEPDPGLPGIEDQARLAAAVDVDLGAAPLFNTLPIRRLELPEAPPGTRHELTMAWVLVPSLEVLPSAQTYTVLDDGRIRYESGTFTADLEVDADGYVTHYPGLAGRPSRGPNVASASASE
jgi:hypothetical protein